MNTTRPVDHGEVQGDVILCLGTGIKQPCSVWERNSSAACKQIAERGRRRCSTMYLKVQMMVIPIVVILLFSFSVPAAAQQSCYTGDVHLVNGSNEREGRVEVCIGGVWGTVCHHNWDTYDALVVCRQLGFEVDVPRRYPSAYHYAQYGQGTGPIFLDDLRCTGEESSLLDCWYYQDKIGNLRSCPHSYDAGVRCPSTNCTNNDVRLAGGLGPTEGRVEVCVEGRWSGVCRSWWNYQDAFVVCRQLGYPATGAVPQNGFSRYGSLSSNLNLTNFRCYGNESHLLNCTHSVSSCYRNYHIAGVLCYGDIVPASPQCYSTGSVRLVGGTSSNEGRVEMCVNGMWGTVTNYQWDSREATVVCKQLGYQNPIAYPYTSSGMFGAGSGPIFLSGLNCLGTEQTLLECSTSNHPYYYSHSSDVGVQCAHRQYSGCTNNTIRLVGRESTSEGRVEICLNGVWGMVCNDSWDFRDARVVCRQLGLPYTGAVAYYNANFSSGSGPYHLDNVRCRGSESSLFSCSRGYSTGVYDCRPGKAAGVKCALSTCTQGDIRLVGGVTTNEGLVEICFSGTWVLVCDYNWNVNESTVVCRQLTGELNPRTSAIRYAYYAYGRSSLQPPYLTSLSCSGLENQLLNCRFSIGSSHWLYAVGVRCYVNSGCTEGDVRLAGGETAMEGRVEVCHNRTWWAVRGSSYWYFSDATVVCRHLHYPANWAIPLSTAHFGRGNATILVQDFGCTGREQSLWECRPRNYSISSYYPYGSNAPNRGPVASVICQGNTTSQPDCSSRDLRLVGGERESEGRVEICVGGFWGTVCDMYSWAFGRKGATVICRQLGMKTLGAIAVGGAYFGEGSGPVHGYIYCSGTESNLAQCSRGSVGQRDCHHGRDVGVICQDPVYSVTVVTHPPSGPHSIGSTVNLTCLIHPQLPGEGVTYQWRDYVLYTSPVVANTSLPYATLTIGRGHPHTARYHCQVYYRNQLLASGNTVITVQGLLSPIGPTDVQYNTSDTVILQVNITPTATFTRNYLRTLTWYHNGVQIIPGSRYYYYYSIISLSSDNTTLTITNAQRSDAGVYHVQFGGLRIYPYNKLCEEETLAILRHYPVLSPVVFNVYTNENPHKTTVEECPVNRGYIKARPTSNSEVLPYTTSDTININISGNVPTTQRNLVYTSWYFDGSGSFPSGTSLWGLRRQPTGISQIVRIYNPTPLHNGTFEVLLRLNYWSYYRQLGCHDHYWNFVSNAGVNPIILDQISFNLEYYEPAAVLIQSSRPALWNNESTTLNCTVDGGYPPIKSISWVKNGRVISTSDSNEELVITVAANDTHAFGRYKCLVNNSVTTMETSFLMKQKGELQVVLVLESSRQCESLNMDAQQMLKTGIANIIQEMCSCNFTSSDLEESEVTCSADDNTTMTFTTTVVYSTESGNMTASTLIRMFQERAASISTVISVGSQTATIVSVCNPSCTPEPQPSPTSTPELQLEKTSPTICTPEPQVEELRPTIAPELPEEEPRPTIAPELPVEEPHPTIAPELPVEEPHPTITPELPVGDPHSTITPKPQAEQPSPTTAPEPQEAREPLTSNIAILVGVYLGGLATGIIILIIAAVIKCVLAKRKSTRVKGGTRTVTQTRAVTQTSTKATAASKDVDLVRYTCESLQIGPNAAYESVTFQSDEPIYDQPM